MIEVVVTALPPGFAISREWARSRPTYTLWLHGCVVSTGPDMYPLRWQANRMAAPTTP